MKIPFRLRRIFLFLALVSALPALGQQPVLTKIPPPEGVFWSAIMGMGQDPQGFVWLATQNGLFRYDGYRYVPYYHDPDNANSPASNRTNSLFVAKSGIVWIGYYKNGLDRFDPATRAFTHFTHDPNDPASLSSNTVISIREDRQGVLWVGTISGLNRLHPKSGTFTRYLHHPQDPTSLSSNIAGALYEDRQGTLWVGTGSLWELSSGLNLGEGGLNRFDPEKGTFTRFFHDPKDPNSLTNNKVRAIFEDSRGTFWVGTLGDGLHTMDREEGTSTRHRHDPRHPDKLSRAPIIGDYKDGVNFILEDVTGAIWIGTFGSGVSRYNPTTKKVAHLVGSTSTASGLQDNQASVALNLKEGVLLIGTHGEGQLYRTDPLRENFAYQPTGARVLGFAEDAAGKVWVATEKGLRVYGQSEGNGSWVSQAKTLPASLEKESARSLLQDSKGSLWVGGHKGLWRQDPENQVFTLYAHDPQVPASISPGVVSALHEGRDGVLWVGTESGLNRMDPKNGTFTKIHLAPNDHSTFIDPYVTTLKEDKFGNLWVGTLDAGVYRIDRPSGAIKHYLDRSGHTITAIKEDASGRLWAGTIQFGLFWHDPEKDAFVSFTDKSTGRPLFANVMAMEEDAERNLWVSSLGGLAKLNREGILIANYGEEAGLKPETFGYLAAHRGKKGTLYIGATNGFYSFMPQKARLNQNPPQIVLTDFRLFDEPVVPGEDGPLRLPVGQAKEIDLRHHQNAFSFEFAGIHFTNPGRNRHLYLLENYDTDWREAKEDPSAAYYQVPPGEYVFRVRAASSEGVWAERALPVVVRPPWWRTWWAYGLYGLLVVAGLWLARQETVRRERRRAGLRLQQVEAEKLREVDALKSHFFSNVSHEFRTPLALIQGTVQKLARKEPPMPENLPDYQLIHRSSKRLLQLVNQLLDLSRLEAGKLTFHPEPGEVTGFLHLLASSFASLFENKGIRYRYQLPQEPLWALFEADKLEKILSNLLSNACKFTPAGGEVELEVKVEQPTAAGVVVHLCVRDSGIGIPAEVVPRVFDRFFQADSSLTRFHEGAGTGLALTKELVELHGGTISVESSPGQGSTFRINLPLPVAGRPETEGKQASHLEREALIPPDPTEKSREEKPARPGQPVVLVVEDNADLRHFIRDSLPAEYAVFVAEDGLKGWEKALKLLPDLIISDVMMPGLDGVSLCQRVKADERTSHVALILLTAKADAESKMAGLETGADDYLTKPFRLEELQLRVHNLLESRRKLRERYSRSLTLQPAEVAVTSVDERFLQKVLEVVEQHLADPGFDGEMFSREVGMSRVHLHRKLKALTDKSPGELIRTFRLKRAASLLEQQAGNISEVAFAVGFNSLPYFTKCFREQYGQTPTEYLQHYQLPGQPAR